MGVHSYLRLRNATKCIYISAWQRVKNRLLKRLLQVRGLNTEMMKRKQLQHFVSKGKNGIDSINRKIFFFP